MDMQASSHTNMHTCAWVLQASSHSHRRMWMDRAGIITLSHSQAHASYQLLTAYILHVLLLLIRPRLSSAVIIKTMPCKRSV